MPKGDDSSVSAPPVFGGSDDDTLTESEHADPGESVDPVLEEILRRYEDKSEMRAALSEDWAPASDPRAVLGAATDEAAGADVAEELERIVANILADDSGESDEQTGLALDEAVVETASMTLGLAESTQLEDVMSGESGDPAVPGYEDYTDSTDTTFDLVEAILRGDGESGTDREESAVDEPSVREPFAREQSDANTDTDTDASRSEDIDALLATLLDEHDADAGDTLGEKTDGDEPAGDESIVSEILARYADSEDEDAPNAEDADDDAIIHDILARYANRGEGGDQAQAEPSAIDDEAGDDFWPVSHTTGSGTGIDGDFDRATLAASTAFGQAGEANNLLPNLSELQGKLSDLWPRLPDHPEVSRKLTELWELLSTEDASADRNLLERYFSDVDIGDGDAPLKTAGEEEHFDIDQLLALSGSPSSGADDFGSGDASGGLARPEMAAETSSETGASDSEEVDAIIAAILRESDEHIEESFPDMPEPAGARWTIEDAPADLAQTPGFIPYRDEEGVIADPGVGEEDAGREVSRLVDEEATTKDVEQRMSSGSGSGGEAPRIEYEATPMSNTDKEKAKKQAGDDAHGADSGMDSDLFGKPGLGSDSAGLAAGSGDHEETDADASEALANDPIAAAWEFERRHLASDPATAETSTVGAEQEAPAAGVAGVAEEAGLEVFAEPQADAGEEIEVRAPDAPEENDDIIFPSETKNWEQNPEYVVSRSMDDSMAVVGGKGRSFRIGSGVIGALLIVVAVSVSWYYSRDEGMPQSVKFVPPQGDDGASQAPLSGVGPSDPPRQSEPLRAETTEHEEATSRVADYSAATPLTEPAPRDYEPSTPAAESTAEIPAIVDDASRGREDEFAGREANKPSTIAARQETKAAPIPTQAKKSVTARKSASKPRPAPAKPARKSRPEAIAEGMAHEWYVNLESIFEDDIAIETHLKNLSKLGVYPETKVVYRKSEKPWYRLSVTGFWSEEEARAYAEKIKREHDLGSWLSRSREPKPIVPRRQSVPNIYE